ncbi:sulfite exporter TauE/SafE family protein [Alcaligenaceae bacterium]|nr:sulfite exporter TauE/SafE family protein [Alcaligenaceae bacterium]
MILTELLDGYALPLVWLVILVFVLAGLVKGVVGLGLPTISMALLSLFMLPAHAATLLVIPSLVTNVWQTRPFSGLAPMLRRIGGMQVGVIAGTLAGAVMLGAPAGAWAAVSLGLALLAYSAWAMFGRPFTVPGKIEGWLGPLVGVMTGFITAATGVFVVPAVPYLQSLGLARDELIQAMGVSFTVSTVALAAGLWLNDSYSMGAAGASLIMLVPALIGMGVGTRLRHSLAPAVFRRCFLISLAVVGVYMLIKGWW